MVSASREGLGEDADSRPWLDLGDRLRRAAEHAGFGALGRELNRRPPAAPLATAVFGISPNGDPELLKISSARPLWWTEGTSCVPFAPLPISVQPSEAPFAGMPDVRASVLQASRFGPL